MLYHLVEDHVPDVIAPGAEGFVHLCTEAQLDGVRQRHFFGKAVIAVAIDPSQLDAGKLIEEDRYGHGAYPHYFGTISGGALVAQRAIAEVARADVERALPIVRRHFPATPLLRAHRLSRLFGGEIWLKLDALTPIRTFKIRGALVKLETIPKDADGVTTASAGNHGLAVAWAAARRGVPCTVVVPDRANPQKMEAIRAEGAAVIQHGADYQAAHEHSLALASARGLHYVHAYDDPSIIAGQGTLALEAELIEPELVACGIGGGGLIAGLGAAWCDTARRPRLLGVQPQGADSMARSFDSGKIETLERVDTLADGLGARRPGTLTFSLARRFVDRVIRVPDRLLVEALRVLLREERIVAEPAGVAGLAALLAEPELARGRVLLPITGANVSDELLAEVLRST